jgi:CRP/FNR family transcriptional regulator, anaerobic regulatory protein
LGTYADMSTLELGAMRYACDSCSLNELCRPMRLEPADLQRLQSAVKRAGPLAAGNFLFRVGDPFTAIYAVRSGCIKSFSIDAGGHESVHGFHLRGELLGFDAVYPDRHRCNALILEDVSLCVVPYRDIASLSAELPSLQSQVLRLMSREFSRHVMFGEGSGATQRLALFLTDMYDRLRQPDTAEYQFTLPMSREDISNHLGITAETLSRLFAKLQRKGIIDVDRRHVFLADPIRLDLIAQGVS